MDHRLAVIEGRIVTGADYLSPVTYVPAHAKGDAMHKDCRQGVIIRTSGAMVRVLYSYTRTTRATKDKDLVWG